VTGQEADFDEDLDFDCFLLTGLFEAVDPDNRAFSASSNFRGFSEIGFSLAMLSLYRKLLGLTKYQYDSHIIGNHFYPR
jgi:hypothetical protein